MLGGALSVMIMGSASVAGAASPKPKPLPKLQTSLSSCLHTLGTWTAEVPAAVGETNAIANAEYVSYNHKAVGGASVTTTLTGPDVINAGGTESTYTSGAYKGQVELSGSDLPIFGANGLYTLSWTATKKGYARGGGHLTFQAVAGTQPSYGGGYAGVICEGWTMPPNMN